jgi:hypothetical protein
MHITKESYTVFERAVRELEGSEEFMIKFKEILGDPTKSEYSREKYERSKARVRERTGEKTSRSTKDALQRYYERNKESLNAKRRERYHAMKGKNEIISEKVVESCG